MKWPSPTAWACLSLMVDLEGALGPLSSRVFNLAMLAIALRAASFDAKARKRLLLIAMIWMYVKVRFIEGGICIV